MPLFRRASEEEREASRVAEAEQAASLEALARGELPVSAQQRLAARVDGSAPFTSDFSVAGFALAHRLGLRPVAQVMGSSVYHVGWQQRPGSFGWQPGG